MQREVSISRATIQNLNVRPSMCVSVNQIKREMSDIGCEDYSVYVSQY